MYEMTLSHPMDEAGKWLNIGVGCIVKAPAPVRETPLAVEDDEGVIPTEPETVTRRIYKVQTNTGANLHLRQGPSTSTRILSKYRPGTESHHTNTLELIAETATAAAIDVDALMDALGPEDERVKRFLALTGGEAGASVMERGMATHTGEGDGTYPVCVYRDGDGRACRIVIIF